MSGSRSLCRLKANLRHDLCNIVEHSPVYGTLIQIPPFLLIVSMLLSKKQNKCLEVETMDITYEVLEMFSMDELNLIADFVEEALNSQRALPDSRASTV